MYLLPSDLYSVLSTTTSFLTGVFTLKLRFCVLLASPLASFSLLLNPRPSAVISILLNWEDQGAKPGPWQVSNDPARDQALVSVLGKAATQEQSIWGRPPQPCASWSELEIASPTSSWKAPTMSGQPILEQPMNSLFKATNLSPD